MNFLAKGPMDVLFLNFRDRDLEHSYGQANYLNHRKSLVAALFLGSFAFALYYIVDYLILGRHELPIIAFRFLGYPLANLSLGLVLKFSRSRKRINLDILGGLYIVIGQIFMFLIAFLYPQLGNYYLFAFLLLSLYAQSSYNSINFKYLLLAIIPVLITFEAKLIWWDHLPTPELVMQVMISSMCIFLVLRSGYLIERAQRIDFLKQNDLELRQKELIAKNKELEQFAYIASHDLQEPLRSITSFSNLLNEDFRDQVGPEGSRYLDYLLEASNRMRNLIKGLLDYSRLGREMQLVTVNSADVFHAVCMDLTVAIAECHASVTAESLPNIKGYETEFRQLLQNLLSNALKFRSPQVAPLIRVKARQAGSFWEFSVTDNGIGIAPENQEKIFLIFQRLHTRSTYEGTGIGLANCRKIVELHGGSIRVESKPGEGSKFIFTIPIR